MVVLAVTLSPTVRRAGLGSGIRLPAWDALVAAAGVIGAWQIDQSVVFGPATVKWLSFADGVAIVSVGLVALALHELSTERDPPGPPRPGGAFAWDPWPTYAY